MKFPRFARLRSFISGLNPYATIRDLRDRNAELERRLFWENRGTAYWRTVADAQLPRILALRDSVEQHETACEAFMAERAELKAELTRHVLVGLNLVSIAQEQEEVIAASEKAHAGTVEYVKTVEAALAAAGVTVQDTEEGPKVVVDPAIVVSSIRSGAASIVSETTAVVQA